MTRISGKRTPAENAGGARGAPPGWRYGGIPATDSGYCVHGLNVSLYRCPKCQEQLRQEGREDALYATLDKLAAAVDALAAELARRNGADQEDGDSR